MLRDRMTSDLYSRIPGLGTGVLSEYVLGKTLVTFIGTASVLLSNTRGPPGFRL
jgi:hypothetical protein